MASRKSRIGTAVETNFSTSKYSVVGLRPIKERSKRSEAMVEEQMLFIKETQRAMQKTLENFEKALTENDQQKSEGELERLFKRSEELLVIVQVLVKIRNELAYGRLDLERAIKANNGVGAAKKRVKWLQERLEKVLLTAKSCCHLYNQCLPTKKSNTPEFKEQISERLWNRLPAGQQKFLLERKNKRSMETKDERNYATPIVKEIEKMVSQPSASDSVSEWKKEMKDLKQSIEGTEIIQENTTNTKGEVPPINRSTSPKRKQRRRSDNLTRGVWKNSDPNNLGRVPPGLQVHQSDEESDTTAEPYSDPEDYDEQRSDSILSSVDAPDAEAAVPGMKTTPDVKVCASLDDDDDNDDDDVYNDNDDSSLNGQGKATHGMSLKIHEHLLKNEKSVDQVEEYWNSDHHRFEWSNYMQSIDPSSWHALGLVIPESFLSKEKPRFDPDLPWKEKPMKVNSVIDVHKIALDKLLIRLHRMYEAIGQATQATIDPILKDTKIETVMGKLEFETDTRPAVEITKQEESQQGMTNHASHVSLPQIVSPIAAQRSFMSSEMHPTVPTPPPAAIRTARQNTQKMYPQHSLVWCDTSAGGYKMPQIVKTKPNFSKRRSLAQPRYLAPRKQESRSRIQHISDLDLANKSLWKPSMVMKVVTVLKAFSDLDKEPAGTLNHDSPKWRRIETLLGDGGVLSSNPTIAAEAAKTLGQLKCHDTNVIDTLREVIKKQTDARVGYEASKSMILLGSWDPYAVEVIKQSMKTGNKDVVLELLSTMNKARNIAFVDKSTREFKELVEILILTVKTQCPELAFHAAVSLGRLCVVEPVSRTYLIKRLPELCARDKGEALFVLIRQMNCKDKLVVEALLEQLNTAHNWKLRMEAADMLIFIGARDLFKVTSTDDVFDILERLLWDHANKELRSKVAEALCALGLQDRACQLVTRRLEDPADEVRARAVISLATLGMKGVKEMKALLDILELDSSGYVRIQVVRAFGHMEWNDPRILRSLREREKGDGTLAMEARKTLAFLSRLPGGISVAE